jgi:hypothetical protein
MEATMSADLNADLNTTITAAVQARVEAAVAEALAGGELIGEMVRAALNQTVEVPGANGYSKDRVPFLRSVLWKTIQQATADAVRAAVAEDAPLIEAEVRKAIKRDAPEFAAHMVGRLVEQTKSSYGMRVEVHLPRAD